MGYLQEERLLYFTAVAGVGYRDWDASLYRALLYYQWAGIDHWLGLLGLTRWPGQSCDHSTPRSHKPLVKLGERGSGRVSKYQAFVRHQLGCLVSCGVHLPFYHSL
jgi:hypothetical protein